jgi:ParB family chromosome partitioning protein
MTMLPDNPSLTGTEPQSESEEFSAMEDALPDEQEIHPNEPESPPNEPEKRTNLGRGLAALFGEEDEPSRPPVTGDTSLKVPVEQIHPNPWQPRQNFDEAAIKDLADSIRENGILQPILVRRHPEQPAQYQLIAGERRWRAAQLAQLHEVPVVVRELSDLKALEIALLENVQREDLTPLEEAEGYQRLLEEFNHTQANLAQALGKSRSHITNTLRLLGLPEDVKTLLQRGALTAGHARALLSADEPQSLAREVVSRGLSVRQIEAKVQQAKVQKPARKSKGGSGKAAAAVTSHAKDADTLALEEHLTEVLGLKVAIDFRGLNEDDEHGSLTIAYQSLEQLDDVLDRLSRPANSDD